LSHIHREKMREFSVNWMDKSNIDRFLSHLKGKPNVHFLEIGSLEGMTTCYLLDFFLTHPTATITAVDPCVLYPIPGYDNIINSKLEQIFLANTREFGQKVIFYKDYSANVLPKLRHDSFDFIYVDGDHRRDVVYQDAIMSFRVLKPGGIIIFDDYLWMYDKDKANSPHDGIDRFLGEFKPQVLAINNQVVIKKG